MSADQRAGLVAVASHLWGSPVHAAAAELVDPRPGESVVDLGAGFGAATLHLARRLGPGGRATAVDPSRTMRAAIRARCGVHRVGRRIDVRSGTAERLPLGDHSVDGVLAMNVVHLLSDVDAVAGELARVMRRGGRCFFIEEDLDDPGHRFHHAEPHAPDGPTVDDLAGALDRNALATVTDRRYVGDQPATVVSASARG